MSGRVSKAQALGSGVSIGAADGQSRPKETVSVGQSTKRKLGSTSEVDPPSVKRARNTQTKAQPGHSRRSARLQARQRSGDTQQSRVDQKEVLRLPKAVRQPNTSKFRQASLLEPKVEGLVHAAPATSLRKRQAVGDGEPQLKRARLTQENLALFDTMAKKKASKTPAQALVSSGSTAESTKTISTTSSGFAIQAYENGILPPIISRPPKNLDAIRNQLDQSRATASPPESQYEDYVYDVEVAPNKATVVFEVGKKLLKDYPRGYTRIFNQAFTNFPKDVGFNNGLSAPQPDFVEGLGMQEFHPFPAGKQISGAVLYKDNPFSLALPHIAGEWKGPRKDMAEAKMQSGYDGAALVYARNQALEYIWDPDPTDHAQVMTFMTDGSTLNFYTHYATPLGGDDETVQYHQYPVATTNMKASLEEFKKGYRQMRNAQDSARERSVQLRDRLRAHWKTQKAQKGALLPGEAVPSVEKAPYTEDVQVVEREEAVPSKANGRKRKTSPPSRPQRSSKRLRE